MHTKLSEPLIQDMDFNKLAMNHMEKLIKGGISTKYLGKRKIPKYLSKLIYANVQRRVFSSTTLESFS